MESIGAPASWIGVIIQAILAIAFTVWAAVVKNASTKIEDKIEKFTKDLHQYVLNMERRVTRLEAIQEFLLRKHKAEFEDSEN